MDYRGQRALGALLREGFPKPTLEELAGGVEEERLPSLELTEELRSELRRVHGRYSRLPMTMMPPAGEGMTRGQYEILLQDCTLSSEEALGHFERYAIPLPTTREGGRAGHGAAEAILGFDGLVAVLGEIAHGQVPVRYSREAKADTRRVDFEHLLSKYVLWGGTVSYGTSGGLEEEEDASVAMEELFLQAEPFLRRIFDHYAVVGPAGTLHAMTRRQALVMAEDTNIVPHFLSASEASRISHWSGDALLGGQLDYDHWCLWLAKAATVGYSQGPPQPDYPTSCARLEALLLTLDGLEFTALLYAAESTPHLKCFTHHRREIRRREAYRNLRRASLDTASVGGSESTASNVAEAASIQAASDLESLPDRGGLGADRPELPEKEEEGEGGEKVPAVHPPPPRIPELGVDYGVNLRRSSAAASSQLGFDPRKDHDAVGAVLVDWARREGLEKELAMVWRHYSVVVDRGTSGLLSKQFVKLVQDAGLDRLNPARSAPLSEANLYQIYLDCRGGSGIAVDRGLSYPQYLSSVAACLAQQNYMGELGLLLEKAKMVLAKEMTAFARAVRQAAAGWGAGGAS